MENNSADSVDSMVAVEPKIPASEDGIDARPNDALNKKQQTQSAKSHIPRSAIDENSPYYDMAHEQRGLAIILNHFIFQSKKYKNLKRHGTEIDCQRLRKAFELLDFKVKEYHDLKREEINKELQKVADMDHGNNDCIVVIVLSHGETGRLEALDGSYDVNEIWEPFLSCPTLVGKPKIFFIQACRGSQTDPGIPVMSMEDASTKGDMVDSLGSKPKHFLIPSMADLLVMYSTYEGYFAFRNPRQGSCFIQALCDELELNGRINDLLNLLTAVCRRVAFTFQSNVPKTDMDAMKQMPSIVSMLTKTLYFTKKNPIEKKFCQSC
ncbi:Caspase-1 [Pseudolycoriella hygida]|uniref:Caspase-1 n=1 Tax=Pseudolycoriella hygida TaxID=35572 RepID=A0A9Q0RZ53_9DIPT|nr:Caspase-1 [Pseudolycoriella hygida]